MTITRASITRVRNVRTQLFVWFLIIMNIIWGASVVSIAHPQVLMANPDTTKPLPSLEEIYRSLARHCAGMAEAYKQLQKVEEAKRTQH